VYQGSEENDFFVRHIRTLLRNNPEKKIAEDVYCWFSVRSAFYITSERVKPNLSTEDFIIRDAIDMSAMLNSEIFLN
jgi:hypothetical protein